MQVELNVLPRLSTRPHPGRQANLLATRRQLNTGQLIVSSLRLCPASDVHKRGNKRLFRLHVYGEPHRNQGICGHHKGPLVPYEMCHVL